MLKFTRRLNVFMFAAAAALALRPGTAQADTTNSTSDRLVVMISVDGLAADYLDDPKAEMPTIRKLAAEGARAASMKAVTPTVTWPNHTTLVTGDYPAKHGVVGNNYLDRATGKKVTLISDPVYDKTEIVKVPTIYDVAKSNGLKTAGVRWPATRNAPTLDWQTPDVRTTDLVRKYTTPALAEDCLKANINIFRERPEAAKEVDERPIDDTYTEAFNLILKKYRPNLALLHLVNVDHTQHLNGPRDKAAYEAIKIADGHVREVLEEVQRDYPGKATIFVVSDHGFSEIKRTILPNVVLRKAGLLGETEGKKKTKGDVQIVVQSGCALIYIRDGADKAKVTEQVKNAFNGVDGVLKVVAVDEFKKYGVADPAVDPHAPDMVLFVKEGYTTGDTAAGELPFKDKPERRGTHGHDPNIPHLHATFVAWGAGIKPGVKLGEISNLDVAPTIAELLNVSLPGAEGKPLKAVLAK